MSIVVPEDTSAPPLETPTPILLDGSQQVKKFNRQFPDDIRILLAIYRLESKGVDIVLSANLPIAKESGGGLDEAEFNSAKEYFLTAAKSLKVLNFDLFA